MFETLIPLAWNDKVLAMQPVEFWLASLFILAVASGMFYAIFRFVHRARLLEDIPTSKVRSAAQGYVELEGLAELMPGEAIIAPLSGKRCTWYRYKIEERVEERDSRGGRSTHWHTLDSGTSDNLFLLVDETGECVIDPEGAEVTPAVTQTWYGNSATASHADPNSSRFGGLLAQGRFRYREERIHPADSLYAIGLFRTVGGSQELPNTAEEVKFLLNRWKHSPDILKTFDQNSDGKIDIHEWEAVRQAAHKQVRKEQAERFHQAVFNMLARPEGGRRPYILSTHPQEKMVGRYRLYAALSSVVFLVAGATASWLFAARF